MDNLDISLANSISPVSEVVSLIEAEKTIREREQRNEFGQANVIQQIEVVLKMDKKGLLN